MRPLARRLPFRRRTKWPFLPTRESTNDLVLIAAGVGITPMASMLRWSLEQTPERSVILLNQVKDDPHIGRSVEHCMPGKATSQACRHIRSSAAWNLRPSRAFERAAGAFHAGKLDEQALAPFIKPKTDYYMCGPDAWMESMRQQNSRRSVSIPPIFTGNRLAARLRSSRNRPLNMLIKFASSLSGP